MTVLCLLLALAAAFAFAPPASGVEGGTLAFIQQPSDVLAGQPITPAVTVAFVDGGGNVVTGFNQQVTVALQGAGTLYGTTTRTAVNGVATFSGLIVNPAGTYTLLATTPSKPSAVSDPFDVTGSAVNCLRTPCEASTGNIKAASSDDPTAGYVKVPVAPCTTSACFLTVIEDQSCPPEISCRGNAFLFIPPPNARGITVAKLACDVSICPIGETIPTFKQRTDGTWVKLAKCPSSNPTPEQLGPDGCIQNQVRTPGGDLLTAVWLPQGDPRIVN